MAEAPSLPATASRPRIAFVDAARSLAMLLMLQAHVCDNLLAESWKATAFFQTYWKLRGLTGPLFFFLSGFAFVVASDSHWEDYGRPGKRLWKRLRRVATLMLLGFFFQMPRWSGHPPFDFSPDDWHYLLRSGVLHCIGWSLITALALVGLTRSRRAFTWAAGAVCLAFFGLAPLMEVANFRLPLPLAMLLQPGAGSIFPLFPFLAYFMVGLVIGRLYLDRPALLQPARRLGLWALGTGVALTGLRLAWETLGPGRGADPQAMADPRVIVLRLGGAALLFALVTLAIGDRRSPRWLKSASSNALSIYVVHLVALYGAPHLTGLLQRFGPTLSLPQAFLTGPLLLIGCALFMGGWDFVWSWVPRGLAALRSPTADEPVA